MGKRILLLEKERNLAHFLSLELQKEQYRVDLVEEGRGKKPSPWLFRQTMI